MKRCIFLAASFSLCAVATLAAEDILTTEERMRQQLALHPQSIEARFGLARSLAWQRRFDESEAEFSRLLRIAPNNADFLLGAAQVQLWRGNPAAALSPLRKARRLAPRYAEIWRTQIKALLALGDADRRRQASIILQEAQRRFPDGDWNLAGRENDAAPIDPAPANAATPVAPTPTVVLPVAAYPSSSALAATPSPIAKDAAYRFAAEAGGSIESLTHNLPNWKSRYLLGEWRDAEQRVFYGGLRETERYGLKDTEVQLGSTTPLDAAFTLQWEAGVSEAHRVLPKHYGSIQVLHRPAPGWNWGVGLRRSSYAAGYSRVVNLGADYSFDAQRMAYTLYLGAPDGASLVTSHRWQWAYYYHELDWIGLTLIRGRESEYAANGFLTSAVSGSMLSGRHAITADWAAVWEASILKQGDFYTRQGVRFGLRHTF